MTPGGRGNGHEGFRGAELGMKTPPPMPTQKSKPLRVKQYKDDWQGETLPDYLKKKLDIVFVGLNPGRYSAEVGHYFANKVNRFWELFFSRVLRYFVNISVIK